MALKRKWTAEEEAQLMHLRDAGASLAAIAKRLGRGIQAVDRKQRELYTLLAKHEKRNLVYD